MSWPELLHPTLTRRVMPETVARIITSNLGSAWRRDWTADELVMLRRAVSTRPSWYVTSMREDFELVPDCSANVATAFAVHGLDPALHPLDPASAGDIAHLIDTLGAPVGWRHGMDWKADRLTAGQRRELPRNFGGGNHGRAYNKQVRVLRNLWDHAVRMQARQEFRRLVLVGRSGFACDIPPGRFCADPAAAAFVAYITARKNQRRQFTLAGKDNPVDQIAAMMLARCERSPGTDWEMIAQVWPKPDILRHLDAAQTGQLLGQWWTVMRDCSVLLAAEWASFGDVDRTAMIVRRGMDSSSWNTIAQAYNAARAAWLNCATAAAAGALSGPFCPGKVMRVMAADLAAWHSFGGGGIHPDTRAWALLPYPWDVIAGLADCSAADVGQACRRAGVDPVLGGWTAPLPKGAVAAFKPTPELVHGVEVASPEWAGLLRAAGVFSGKKIRAGDEGLREAAERAGVVTGPLPAYDRAGGYAGTVTGGVLDPREHDGYDN